MRVAVLSDIHGFSPAFETVLADVDTQSPDRIVVAGDLCEGGPNPARVIELLRERQIECVYGNTDRDLASEDGASGSLEQWVRDEIGPDGIDFLRSLPFSLRIGHPDGGAPGTDLLVVHANPTDVDRHLSPNASEREIMEIIGDETAATIAFGHLHVAYTRNVGSKTLVDVSAVGNPRDGDLRPRYVLFSPAVDGAWSHEYRYLDYPLDETRRAMETSGMPDWRKAIRRLERAEYGRAI